jgi:hypothetical protein
MWESPPAWWLGRNALPRRRALQTENMDGLGGTKDFELLVAAYAERLFHHLFDFGFVAWRVSYVIIRYFPVSVDDDSRGQHADPVSRRHFSAFVDHDGICQFEIEAFDEFLDAPGAEAVEVHTHRDEPVISVTVVNINELWHFLHARYAIDRPEIEQNGFLPDVGSEVKFTSSQQGGSKPRGVVTDRGFLRGPE